MGALSVSALPERTVSSSSRPTVGGREWIEGGAVLCHKCKTVYPLHAGVPIFLTYRTALSERTAQEWPVAFRNSLVETGFTLPTDKAPRGEEFVSASFSTEWAEYDYGPTLWTGPTADRIRTFHGEMGLRENELRGKRFCEIGCGLGILTNDASSSLGGEAWGIDLSTAVFRAAAQFHDNVSLHFVQASIFAAPFPPGSFDFVYTHGVLHHTWSTKAALARAAALVAPGGSIYVWLYGYGDVRVSLIRRVAYAGESVVRPLVARLPSWLATLVQIPLIPMYQLASFLGKRSGTHATVYSPREALHAARDRFTPLFAHRHEAEEVAAWLKELGFQAVSRVDGAQVAPSWRTAIDRNVALRARR